MTCPGVKLEKFLLPLFVFLMNKKCQGVLIWMWWGIIYISLKKKIFKIGTESDID